jgi:hypothetical protein
MSFNWANFNADEIDTSVTIPANWYPIIFVKSETKQTKSGGEMLVLEAEVLEGQYKKRKVFEQLNLKNPSSQAEQIAHKTLASICKSIGIIHPRGSEELHMKPMMAKVTIQPETDEYPAQNKIKAYAPISDKAKLIKAEPAPATTASYTARAIPDPEPVETEPVKVTLGTPTDVKKPWEA